MSRLPQHASTIPSGAHRSRSAAADQERHDPLRESGRLLEPAVCPDCRAVFAKGRWHWNGSIAGAPSHRCPACRRIREHLPGGVVRLRGEFLTTHRDEVMACVRRVCDLAYIEHPLERLMEIDEDDAQICITTTNAHLARAIGRALKEAREGRLEIDTLPEGTLRVTWER